jgi:hypothetical protein
LTDEERKYFQEPEQKEWDPEAEINAHLLEGKIKLAEKRMDELLR